jgi:maspardin
MHTDHADFLDFYANVGTDLRQSLLDFRAQHPAKTFMHNGITWHYVTLGQGTTTALFLPGAAGAYDTWWQQLNMLANDLHLISISYPPIHSLEGLATGLEALLQQEEVENYHVVGSSLGGYLAQYLVSKNPDRIYSAVFSNTFAPTTPVFWTVPVLRFAIKLLPMTILLSIFRLLLRVWLVPVGGDDPLLAAYLFEYSHTGLIKDDLRARLSCSTQPFLPPQPDRLGVPILIIESDNDPLIRPEIRRALRELYPQAQRYTFKQSGHFLSLSQAKTFAEVLSQFLIGNRNG